MSQIKSYLSLESVPSYEFITPPKNNIQNLKTNNSMAFSQSYGANDSKSNSFRNTIPSNEVFREFNYQLRDEVQQQSEDIINNNSSVTLHPMISKSDINELICTAKMILFLAGESEQKRQLITNKKKGLMALQKGISMVEERLQLNQSLFKSREKSIKSRSLSIQKQSMKKSRKLINQIVDMKLDIKKMERTLSSKKQTLRSSAKKEQRNPFQTERRGRPIYIPIINSERSTNPYTNYHYTSPQPFFGQQSMHQPYSIARSMQPDYFRHQQQRNSSQVLSHSIHYSDKNQLRNSLKKQFQNEEKIVNSKPSNINSNPIFNILKSKLMGAQGSPLFQGPNPIIKNDNNNNINSNNFEAVLSSRKPPSIKSNNSNSKQNSHIKINILPEVGPNLDYLNDDSEDFSQQLLMNTNISKKKERSLKDLKVSSKWKNDEDADEERELLKSLTSAKTIEHGNQDPRNSMGAKIVCSHLRVGEEDAPFEPSEKSRQEQSNSRSQNKSKIEVLFQNSQEKRNDSNSNEHNSKSPSKSLQRQSIINSQLGIVLQDVSDYDESPNKVSFRSNSTKNNVLLKEFPKIQEIEDDGYSRANTPNDFSIFNKGFQPVENIKLGDVKEEVNMQASYPTDKSQSQKSRPLSQPPSLIAQEDDMIDSIKLATNSRYSASSLQKGSSMINKGSNIQKNEQEEDDDFLGGFKLATMSRVSREKIANSASEKVELQQEDFPDLLDSLIQSKIQKKMTQSNLEEVRVAEEKDELDDAIGSNIRNSSTSVIVKKNKNSAIQRSVGHVQKSGKKEVNLKSSLRGSYLSGQLSSPIAEAEEEEEQYSHIIKKHKRAETDSHN